MARTIHLDYFTDILCVWAYASQARLDEIVKHHGDRIEVRHHFIPVFGDMLHRLESKWADRGGRDGFADHLHGVAGKFPHVEVHPDLGRTFMPVSSAPAHLFLKAVQQSCEAAAFERCSWEVRVAWFRDNREIHRMPVLFEIAKEAALPVEGIRERIHSGEAMAAVCRDGELQREMGIEGSPTWVLNEGRQKLYGNVGYRIVEANVIELLEQPEGGASWC